MMMLSMASSIGFPSLYSTMLLALLLLCFVDQQDRKMHSRYAAAAAAAVSISTSTHTSTTLTTFLGKPYVWEEYVPSSLGPGGGGLSISGIKGSTLLLTTDPHYSSSQPATHQPVFVSATTIKLRLNKVARVVRDVFSGTVVPDHFYLFVSREKYILDTGISDNDIPEALNRYIQAGLLTVVFTNNTGPHRKLLPLLQKFWHEDVVIITFDDDKRIAPMAVMKLIKYYIENGKESIVGLRVRRMGLCGQHIRSSSSSSISTSASTAVDTRVLKFKDYNACDWPRVQNSFREMLVLPTGSGGVLYRPRFFHQIVFDDTLRQLTKFNDDLTFRLSTLINEVYVVNGCCESLGPCSVPHVHIADRAENVDVLNDFIINAGGDTESPKLWDSNAGMNSKMWLAATLYLKSLKLLKTDSLLQKYLYNDRAECFSTPFSSYSSSSSSSSYSTLSDAFLDNSFRCNQCHMCQNYQSMRDFIKYRFSNTNITSFDPCGLHICNQIEASRYNWGPK